MASWGPPPAPGAVVREATEEDVPAVVDVYIRAYAQPPWNERHEPVSSEGYLRWVLSQPGAFILVSTDEALRQPPQGIVLASPRDYAEFVRDWERLAERPPKAGRSSRGAWATSGRSPCVPRSQRRGHGAPPAGGDRAPAGQRGGLRAAALERARPRGGGLYRRFGFDRLPVRERVDTLSGPWVLPLTASREHPGVSRRGPPGPSRDPRGGHPDGDPAHREPGIARPAPPPARRRGCRSTRGQDVRAGAFTSTWAMLRPMQTRGPPPNVTRARGGACPPPARPRSGQGRTARGRGRPLGAGARGDGVAHLRPRRDVVPGEVERFQHPSRGLAHGGLQAPGLGHGVVQHAHPAQGLRRDLPVPGIPSVPGGRSDSSSERTRARSAGADARYGAARRRAWCSSRARRRAGCSRGPGSRRRVPSRHGRGTAPASPARPWGALRGGPAPALDQGQEERPQITLHPRQALPEVPPGSPVVGPSRGAGGREEVAQAVDLRSRLQPHQRRSATSKVI